MFAQIALGLRESKDRTLKIWRRGFEGRQCHVMGCNDGVDQPYHDPRRDGADTQINLKEMTLITSHDLETARRAWGDGKVAISKAFETDGIEAARRVASAHLDKVYAYGLGPVMFKPTMASGVQTFRPTKAGALAYFCGHSEDFPLDAGFAIRGWRSMESETSAEFIEGDVAMWMGWVRLTDKHGNTTTVDKSFGYKRDEQGALRLVLHHSSLPFQP